MRQRAAYTTSGEISAYRVWLVTRVCPRLGATVQLRPTLSVGEAIVMQLKSREGMLFIPRG